MIVSNGSVRPKMNRRSSSPPPGIRRWPIANPAIVEMVRAIGTTPMTIVRLESMSVPMLAWLNALTKLSHRGSAGHSIPRGTEPDGCSAVVNRLRNGRIVSIMRTSRSSRPVQTSPRATLTSRSPG